MKFNYILVTLLLIIFGSLNAQNLVNNGDFETVPNNALSGNVVFLKAVSKKSTNSF